MKNPLNKRLSRELKSEFGKYLVLFIFLAGMIALVSGFLVADGSMLKAYEQSFEKYNIEDGNFELDEEASDVTLQKIEQDGVIVYPNSDSDPDVNQLRDLAQQAVDVTAQIYAERSQQTKKEKDHTSEQSDSFCYKIPVQNHIPECTELYYDICRCIFCQSDPVIRLDVQSTLSSL